MRVGFGVGLICEAYRGRESDDEVAAGSVST